MCWRVDAGRAGGRAALTGPSGTDTNARARRAEPVMGLPISIRVRLRAGQFASDRQTAWLTVSLVQPLQDGDSQTNCTERQTDSLADRQIDQDKQQQ
jgi:hypothetical protein